ncbi:MAG: hypothetical protein ABL984_15945 [Pyrinomonadaceae bacterium]
MKSTTRDSGWFFFAQIRDYPGRNASVNERGDRAAEMKSINNAPEEHAS